ncbi:hypothetical protein L1887_05587 [Cichorium endivia]|nr:hypothetical protein L1887_05587 [Cichorium endivia]
MNKKKSLSRRRKIDEDIWKYESVQMEQGNTSSSISLMFCIMVAIVEAKRVAVGCCSRMKKAVGSGGSGNEETERRKQKSGGPREEGEDAKSSKTERKRWRR